MRIVVVGCGHVGLITAVGFAEIGHEVVGIDNDEARLRDLQAGRAPFYEPGVQELLSRHLGRSLSFTGDVAEAVTGADAAFICVNTPPRPDGRLSLAYVEQAARTVAEAAEGSLVIVEKSTVPANTARRIQVILREMDVDPQIEVASNPEFLREGTALHDALNPDRIVVGVANDGGRARKVLEELYEPITRRTGCPLIVTDLDTAELTKHASNSFLAMKISYINMIAELCEQLGADVDLVAEGMGLDPRIGASFLRAGVGYGGFCFPKDVAGLIAQASDAGLDFGLLEQVRSINDRQRTRLLGKVRQAVWNLEGKTIAVWGLAFKPGTDDLREAPSLDVIPAMQSEGAAVRAYDPAAGEEAGTRLSGSEVAETALDAATGADALVVLTDWPEFAETDLGLLARTLRRPVVVDGRNLWSVEDMAAHGFTYLSFGRPDVVAGEIRRP
ncbi:MAG TPA: UDP-glucose/GDP-mannose dehydrogenase family protein [Actinomycetota bacterium]|nr:UDP-glucose/GDP-mannose dehydrogenase family protein [Actinomycetota bacterium]